MIVVVPKKEVFPFVVKEWKALLFWIKWFIILNSNTNQKYDI